MKTIPVSMEWIDIKSIRKRQNNLDNSNKTQNIESETKNSNLSSQNSNNTQNIVYFDAMNQICHLKILKLNKKL